MPHEIQRPGSKLDYTCNWETWLGDAGSPSDTISSSTWSVSPDDGSPSPVISDESIAGDTTTAWLSELEEGNVYRLRNHVTSAQGREVDRDFTVRCGR